MVLGLVLDSQNLVVQGLHRGEDLGLTRRQTKIWGRVSGAESLAILEGLELLDPCRVGLVGEVLFCHLFNKRSEC